MNFIAYRDFGIISWPFSLLFAFLLFKKQMPAFSNSCNLCEFSTSPLLTAALGWKYLWGAKPCDPCSTELCQQKSLKLTHYPAKLHFSQVSSHNPFIILLVWCLYYTPSLIWGAFCYCCIQLCCSSKALLNMLKSTNSYYFTILKASIWAEQYAPS